MSIEDTGQQPKRGSYQDFYDASWNAGLFRPLLIALIAASAVAGPLAIVRAFTSSRLVYVLPLAYLVALEGVYSTNQLGRPRWRDRRGLMFRVGEIFCFLLVVRLAEWVFATGMPDLDDLYLWLIHPGAFFDGQFVAVAIMLFMAWMLAINMAGDFLDLAIQPDEVAAHDSAAISDSRSQMRVFRPLGRSDIMGRFATRWAWGGVALVALVALSRVDVGTSANTPLRIGLGSLNLPPDILAALLCYFVAGLALLSQTRLAVLRGRWYNQDIEVRPDVLRRWHVNALAAMLVIGAVAAFLPIGSTGRFSPLVNALFAILMQVFFLILTLLTLLLTALFYPFRNLFNSNAPLPPMEVPENELITQAEVARQIPAWLGGLLVWLVIGLLASYFVFNYLKAQGVFQGRWSGWLTRLRYWWRARWARIEAAAGAALSSARARLKPVGGTAAEAASLRRIRAGQLPPRERVRYFYLRMISRADAQGVARPQAATPSEFAQVLDREWPDAEEDLEGLTAAFLAARYGARDIPGEEVSSAQDIWRRVMRALRTHAPPDAPPE
jgi:hypothetical protein